MDLIDQLKSEWSKSFPDEPFPSNLSEEKNYNFVTLQNTIKNCEQTINDLNKKIQQEIFLRDFLKKFTEKFYKNENPGTRNEKKPLPPPPPQPSPSTISNSKEQKSAKSLIGSLVTETLSISTLIFDENKKTTTIPSTQSPPPPPFSLNNSCSQSESITDNRILKSENHKEIIFGDKNEKLPRVKIKSEKDATILQKDGSTKPTLNETSESFGVTTATGSSKAAAVDAEEEKEAQVTLSDLKTKRKTINVLSPKSGLEHQAENNAFLRPNLSLRKSMPPPPSLPPKPKRKNLHLSNMTSSSSSSNVALSNTKVNSNNNNNNFKYCTVDESKKGNEKTTLSISSSIDEPSSSSTADLDPHLELDTTTPSVDQFCSRIEVGKCSSGLCEKDVKSGLIESGTTNKAEKKQVDTATVAADELQQPVLKQQQLGLTTTTTTLIETHPINTTTTTTLGSEEGEKEGEKEIITNRVVKATETAVAVAATGNRHNNNKQNNNSNGGLQQQQQQDKNYCGDDDTIQLTTIKEGLGVRPRRPQPSAGSICVDEEEKKLISGERQESQEENKKETLKNNPAFVVVGLDDRRSEKNKKKVEEEEEETEEADCLESGFVGQKLTRKKKERKEEERREEEEDKTNSQHVHDDDSAISPDYKDSKKKRLEEEKESTSVPVPPFLPNNKTTSTDDTPTTSTDTMSTFKKQRDDICFVSYRKLDTEFYEPSFTGNSTLPVPERRSSLLKPTASQTDKTARRPVFNIFKMAAIFLLTNLVNFNEKII